MKVPATLLMGINNFVKHVMGGDPDPVAQRIRSLYLDMDKNTLEMGQLTSLGSQILAARMLTQEGVERGLQIIFKDQEGNLHIGVIL